MNKPSLIDFGKDTSKKLITIKTFTLCPKCEGKGDYYVYNGPCHKPRSLFNCHACEGLGHFQKDELITLDNLKNLLNDIK